MRERVLKMSGKSFQTCKNELENCNKLPDRVKEILNTTNNSLNDLDENNSNELWILLHDFIKETSGLQDPTQDLELLKCYHYILNLVNHAINCSNDVLCVYEFQHLLKSILIFQTFYTKNFKHTFKFEIVKMCCNFCKLVVNSKTQNVQSLDFDEMMTQNFIFTFNYIFSAIKVTTKKCDMKTLSSLLREFCNIMSTLSSNQNVMNLIVFNLEKMMQHTLFLETEAGKLTIADTFNNSQQLFLSIKYVFIHPTPPIFAFIDCIKELHIIRFHQTVKTLLPKTNKLRAEAYGEIYFIAWINSNASMREVIEQQGMFDIISNTFILQRSGLGFHTYHNALLLLQSMQIHRKHLMFSKVITKLYAPVLWRHLLSEYGVVRCNATEILTRAYPLEKRGEGREVASKFLIKQQNAFQDLLEDRCPQVRIAAIKGICSCMRYFWDSFEVDQIIKYFSLFIPLITERVIEIRRVIYYGFCQLLDEKKSHCYFQNPFFITTMKNSLNDENERVRRAFIHFLLKIKKVDSLEENNKINFAKIVNLQDIASALARENKENGLLLVDLIFDNFIGDKVPDRHATLKRFQMFYKINVTAFRKLMLYSTKTLNFNDACKLILSLLKTLYNTLKRTEENNQNKENDIPAKKRKTEDNSDDVSDETSVSSSSTSSVSSNESNKQNELIHICCIVDCVYCLMILHWNTFIDENNHEQMNKVQNSCTTCIIKLLKLYKEGDIYFSALNFASLIPVSKLNSHTTAPSVALSALKQLPYNIVDEEIDMRKVNCLVYTLCMWKRGFEILQFVNIWFDEIFKTLNLNETQYPECIIKEGKRVRFKTNIDECKPMTGVLLINSILNNLQTQKTLMDSDVNKKNIFDFLSYLQRIKPAIENRISSDNTLNNLLLDELLIELFLLNMRLHIIYHSYDKNIGVEEIMKYQTSVLDWVINNLLTHDLHSKNASTIKFAAKLINIVNYIVMNICLMTFVNNAFLDHFITFCATVLHNHLAPRVLLSMIMTLVKVSKHFNYLKLTNNLENNTSGLTNCACRIISIFGESNFNEERFISIIGKPTKFRSELTMLFLEIHRISPVEFKQIFMTLIDTITIIIANEIREIDEIVLNEHITGMSFSANQLTMVIVNSSHLRKMFSSNTVELFSSNAYKKDCVLLLSAICFIYTLSYQLNQKKVINLEPVVKLLYKMLLEHDKPTKPLGENCMLNSIKSDRGVSILEVSDFTDGIMDYKQKGRNILIAIAKKLHITLTE